MIYPSSEIGNSPKNANSGAYVANLKVKAAPGKLYGASGYNSNASAQFLQFFDSSILPADGAVPVLIITVAGSSNFSIDFGIWGRSFTTGIVICNSTTGPTKTIGAADCWIDCQYV